MANKSLWLRHGRLLQENESTIVTAVERLIIVVVALEANPTTR